MREPLHSRKITRGFVLLTLVFLLLLGGLSWQLHVNRNLGRQGQEAHDALCVFKADLQRRYGVGLEFIRTHPRGIPGIPAATLTTSLNNQKATLGSLSRLDCVPPPPPKKEAG